MKRSIHRVVRGLLLLQALLLALIPALPVAAQEFPAPERPIHNGVDAVDVTVLAADNQELSVEYTFPAPHLWVTAEEKINYLQFAIPGMEQAYGELGKPAVPFYSRLLALPQGAEVTVAEVTIKESDSLQQLLYPVQESPVDHPLQQEDEEFLTAAYQDPPFTINDDFYNGDNLYPETPVLVEVLGEMGTLRLARVSVATAQYNTAKTQLTFFASVRFKLSFSGGKDHFLTKRDTIAFNRPDQGIVDLLLNHAVIYAHVAEISLAQFACLGQEYLIITDPIFRTAADNLAAAKNAAGISTSVVETGNGAGQAGTSRIAIKSYISNRYDACLIQLKYVLLLGDAEHIPPAYNRTYGNTFSGIDTPGSDLEYTLLSPNGPDDLPDVALGRIPVDTITQANIVINKIIRYEQTPPTAANFYEDVTVAGYFQCCRPRVHEWVLNLFNPLQLVDGVASRSFIETAELIRAELVGEGYNVNRIYTTDNSYHNNNTVGSAWNYYNPTTRDTTPRFYYNQAPLPAAIGPDSSFNWSGSAGDVIDAFNDGSFLVVHRDHGSKNGWGDPSFKVDNHFALTNGDLTPVVYSINCASGLFDNETRNPASDDYDYNTEVGKTYWAEDLLRRSGGAVAIIGDTRNSPTWANSAMLRGLMDATWPGTVPEGGTTHTRRMGKILNYAKVYLIGQVGVSQTAGSVSTAQAKGNVLMYHLFGDPTMKMWLQNPHLTPQPTSYSFSNSAPAQWTLRHPQEGATVTAMQGATALARGIVENGAATLEFWAERSAGQPVNFVLSAGDAVAVTLPLTQTSTTVTKEKGGSLSTTDRMIKIAIPPGAVQAESETILTDLATASFELPPNHVALRSFQLNATNAQGAVTGLQQPLTMQICVEKAEQKQLKAAFIAYFQVAEGRWTALKSTIDAQNGCVTAAGEQLREFALLRDDSLSFGVDEATIYLPLITR